MFVLSPYLLCRLSSLAFFQNPSDPTTFPGYQPSVEALNPPGQVPISPYIGAENTLANMQTAHGYRGLPTV